MHPMITSTGGMAAFPTTDTRPDVAGGDEVVGCHEPLVDESMVASFPSFAAFPDATRQAFLGLPFVLIWDAVKRRD